jgi:hypothetical protein
MHNAAGRDVGVIAFFCRHVYHEACLKAKHGAALNDNDLAGPLVCISTRNGPPAHPELPLRGYLCDHLLIEKSAKLPHAGKAGGICHFSFQYKMYHSVSRAVLRIGLLRMRPLLGMDLGLQVIQALCPRVQAVGGQDKRRPSRPHIGVYCPLCQSKDRHRKAVVGA